MIRIWAKVMKDDKIVKSIVYEDFSTFEVDDFFDYLSNICHKLDLATPILLAKHVYHYVAFKNTSFSQADFTEDIFFDNLVLEDASNF
ncbi:MAG: hypothetical protein EOM55_00445 [Clostridia bacterium]|nr:hypothetical protein [Clostridia bacterium]